MYFFFFFKQKTAYEIRKGDWSSDVCSSDLSWSPERGRGRPPRPRSGDQLARPQPTGTEAVDGDGEGQGTRLDEVLHRRAGPGGQHELQQLTEEQGAHGAGDDTPHAAEERGAAQGHGGHRREQVVV